MASARCASIIPLVGSAPTMAQWVELTAAWAQCVPTWPLCQTQPFPAPTQGFSPYNMPRVNAKAVHEPGQAGINNPALVAILATGKSQRETPWVTASVCWCSGKGWCRVFLFQPQKCKEPNATKKLSPVPLLHQDKSSHHGEGRAEGTCTVGRAWSSPGISVMLLWCVSSWGGMWACLVTGMWPLSRGVWQWELKPHFENTWSPANSLWNYHVHRHTPWLVRTGGNTKSLSLVILFWVIILFSKCLIQQLQFHFRCSLQVTINPWLLTDGTLHSHLSLSSKHFTKNRNSSSIPWGSQHHWDLLPAQPAAWQSWEQHGHSSYGICWEESTGNGLGCCFEALLFCAVHQWWSWLKVQYPDPASLEKSESPALGNFCRKAQNSLCLFYTLVPRDPLQRCNLSALGGIF